MTEKNVKYFNFVQSASLFFALIIAFWIPSYRWILSDFIGAWLLFSVLEFKIISRFKLNLNGRFTISTFILQLILFLLVLSEVFLADDKKVIINNITQKLSIFIFPVLFALSGKNFKTKKELFLKLFVLSNILVSLLCLSIAFYNSISYEEGKILFEPHYLSYRSYFTNSDLSVFHHRSYFSMYIVFSVAILFWLNEKANIFNSTLKKTFLFLLIVFFSMMVFLLGSRAGIISLFLLFSFELLLKVYLSENQFLKIISPVIIIIMAVLVLRSERVQRTINQLVKSDTKTKKINGKNAPARIVLWSAASDLIENHFWTGTGKEDFQNEFSNEYKKYQNKGLSVYKEVNYNVHNQFLEEFVLYGIFGFLLLLTLFIYPVFYSFKRKNYLFLSFLLITGFNFLFESMLNTIAGIVFFAFFFNYFIFVFNQENKKYISSDS